MKINHFTITSRSRAAVLAASILMDPAAAQAHASTVTTVQSAGFPVNTQTRLTLPGIRPDAHGRRRPLKGPPTATINPFAGRDTTSIIHLFFTDARDGIYPYGGLIANANGTFYGTTASDAMNYAGSVYKMAPPSPGHTGWSESLLYRFSGSDGQEPIGDLISDAAGALYGVTDSGGSSQFGVVYKLTPPAPGQSAWTENVLYSFTGSFDGASPAGGLVADANGSLYGTTSLRGSYATGGSPGGTIFAFTPLNPQHTAWSGQIIYTFTGGTDGAGPYCSLVLDRSGALYGTTRAGGVANAGAVFRLRPPAPGQSRWTQTVLHSFSGYADGGTPYDRLAFDAQGALYGTASAGGRYGNGVVYKLTPPAPGKSSWTQTVLHSFAGGIADGALPESGVTLDARGTIYGTTQGGGTFDQGTAYKLTPPPAGSTNWTETLLHVFTNATPDGGTPAAPLTFGRDGALYGTTFYGGYGSGANYPQSGEGTVFRIAP